MLPLSAGSLVLSADSRAKLEQFYLGFCAGKNGIKYGPGHLMYACHASFPLILSADLANLIWLNFNSYETTAGIQKIDPVAVSDFLLSPLVRKVGAKQYEVIPEIRSYLLFLINDFGWFSSLSIQNMGTERLNSLAKFLRLYISAKRNTAEPDNMRFKELNEWAALAYLEPDMLAFKLAESYKKTFEDKKDKADLEFEQLKLNILMDRFSDQVKLKIRSPKAKEPESFINLQYYSKANKARLFEKDNAEIANLIFPIDTSFISENSNDQNSIQLPIIKNAGDRLLRKKEKTQRVLALLIGIDNYLDQKILDGHHEVNAANEIAQILQKMFGRATAKLTDIQILSNEQATKINIISKLESLYASAFPEDICFIYFGGSGDNQSPTVNYIFPVDFIETNIEQTCISDVFFRNNILAEKNKSGCQTVMVLDAPTGHYSWVGQNDIFIGSASATYRNGRVSHLFAEGLLDIIKDGGEHISYSDIFNYLKPKLSPEFPNFNYKPIMIGRFENTHKYFLTHRNSNSSFENLIFYNQKEKYWEVLSDDFVVPPVSTTTYISSLIRSEQHTNPGELVHRQDGSLGFAGSVTNELNINNIYKIDVERPALYYDFRFDNSKGDILKKEREDLDTQINELKSYLGDHKFNNYALWDNIAEKNANLSGLFVSLEKYQAGYRVRLSTNNKEALYIPFPAEHKPLSEALDKMAFFEYLRRADTNVQRYMDGSMDIDIAYRFGDVNTTFKDLAGGMQQLDLSESFTIDGPDLFFLPLTFRIRNNEKSPVYIKIYFLARDYQLVLLLELSNPLGSREDREFAIESTEKMGEIFMTRNFGLRVLVSRTPIQVPF